MEVTCDGFLGLTLGSGRVRFSVSGHVCKLMCRSRTADGASWTRCAACLSHLALAISCESFRGRGCKQGPPVSLSETQRHGSENPTPLLQVTRGGKPVACLNDTLAAPVSKLQLSRHVVDMISAREQVSFNPQGI